MRNELGQTTGTQGIRFLALDGLRGVAALCVLLLHMPPFNRIIFHGYLAVDLFFMMSGFVVAYAYEGRLLGGWTLGDFMRARVARLWPLYLLGTAIGLAVFSTTVTDPAMAAALTMMAVAGVLLIPLPLGPVVQIFNLNRPAWSLFFEMVANFLYGAFVSRLSNRVLALLTAVGAVAVATTFLNAGSGSLGHHGDSMIGGAARILFAFPLGVLFYRLHRDGKLRLRLSIGWMMAAFLATLMLPDLGPLNGWTDAAVVLLVFPWVILTAITAKVSARLTPAFVFLAALSYPLYILHGPILMAFGQAFGEGWVSSLGGGIASLGFAWAAGRWFDGPARTYLARMLARLSPKPVKIGEQEHAPTAADRPVGIS